MNTHDETKGEILAVETVPAGIVQQHERAAMDMQVATAQQLGRSINQFQQDLESWSCMTQEIAEECTYVLKKGGNPIVGPSIRFAELLQVAYRHIVCETFIEEEAERFIIVGATARDLFRNITIRGRVKRRIVNKHGQRFNVDMIQTTTQAAASLALRNAIIRLIPKALWQGVWLKSRTVAQGIDPDTGKRVIPFAESVQRAITFLGNFDITEAEILAHMRYDARGDFKPDDLTFLRNKARSIQAGEVDPSEAFPEPQEESTAAGDKQAADVASRLDTAKAAAPKKKAAKKKAAARKKVAAKKPEPEPEQAPAEEPADDDGIPDVGL